MIIHDKANDAFQARSGERTKNGKKLSKNPDPGFCDMNGGGVVVRRKTDQITVTKPFDRLDFFIFKKWSHQTMPSTRI